jgi:hypothetical protein
MGDERTRRDTERALERATPFLRRQIGARIRLRHVPELRFEFDKSVEAQDRIERILLDLAAERDAQAVTGEPSPEPDSPRDEPTQDPERDSRRDPTRDPTRDDDQ